MQDRDPEYDAGERRLKEVLTELQEVYLLRLDHALQAVYALQRRDGRHGRDGRGGGDQVLAAGVAEAIAAVRELTWPTCVRSITRAAISSRNGSRMTGR